MRKDYKLVQKTVEQTEELVAEHDADAPTAAGAPTAGDVAPGEVRRNGARQRRRRQAVSDDALPQGERVEATEGAGGDAPARPRRRARREGAERPRVRRGERAPATTAMAEAEPDAVPNDEAAPGPIAAAPPDSLIIGVSGKNKSKTRTATRIRNMQRRSAAAVAGMESNPALGALNRHLNLMTQQLTTAHRVLGRVAAERDALRQQLADLQGVPVEEIIVSSIGTSTEDVAKPAVSEQPETPSRWARLNYFGGDDVALMRRRRQTFVLGLLLALVVLAVAARQLGWAIPTDISREGMTAIPVIGNLMVVFLAGWMLFRVVRVSSKGVRWVFPSDDRKRRRR